MSEYTKRKKEEKRLQIKKQVKAAHEKFMNSDLPDGILWPILMSPEIEPLYSTLDVAKVLNIPRERLRDWMVRGFVSPSIHAGRKGAVSIFTIRTVLKVKLFQLLLNTGFRRKRAAQYLKATKWGIEKNFNFIIFSVEETEVNISYSSGKFPHPMLKEKNICTMIYIEKEFNDVKRALSELLH